MGTGGQAINAGQASITYPTDLLEVVSVSRSGSIFTLWPVEPAASGGQISFAGGVPNPGYTGNGGLITSVRFKAKAIGTATVRVSSGQLLLNDGSGTNILTGYGTATYTITEVAPTPTQPTPTEPTPPKPEEKPVVEKPLAPVIYSDSHPEEGVWYSNNNPEFIWDKLSGVTDFSFSFDDQPTTIPDGISEGSDNFYQYFGTKDGIWYFHAKAKNEAGWSETKHFKVQIDITPPLDFDIVFIGETVTKNQTPNIVFETIDETSGLNRYDILVDGRLADSLSARDKKLLYTLYRLYYGTHNIVVRAVDNAGNSTEAAVNFEIVKFYPGTGFRIGSIYLLYSWVLMAQSILIFLIILLLIIVLLRKRQPPEENQVKKQIKKIKEKTKKPKVG